MIGKLLCLFGFHLWEQVLVWSEHDQLGEFIQPTTDFVCLDCWKEFHN
jgi:hypothetical protein